LATNIGKERGQKKKHRNISSFSFKCFVIQKHTVVFLCMYGAIWMERFNFMDLETIFHNIFIHHNYCAKTAAETDLSVLRRGYGLDNREIEVPFLSGSR
jgi:hypothetical protein